ncbi:hypothetical protein ACFWDQ_22440 [Streptomyces sp. NPDC060053]|uniref:hypothetical protein n=1 Tax=Streptomyces sp. NPDC060053 TaxID=3347047 RepID=UPI003695AA51
MYQIVVAAGLSPSVGDGAGTEVEGTAGTRAEDCAGTGVEDRADTVDVHVGVGVGVGLGRGSAVALSDGCGDRAGVSDRTGVDVVFGTAEVREVVGTRSGVPLWLGRVGCPVVTVDEAARDSVGAGGAVLEVFGADVAEGSGSSVGKDRSLDADGAGRGVPSSDAVSAQVPRPPATRTAAPATIHGALRGGLR